MDNQILQNQEKPKKSYWKFVAVFLGIVILVGIGYFILRFYSNYSAFQSEKEKYEQAVKPYLDLEKTIKEDIYGGKTPEETFDMFLDALKKGDIELASKYFVVEKQEKYKEELKNRSIKELERIRKTWRKNGEQLENETFYVYDVIIKNGEKIFDPLTNTYKELPSGIYENEIIFFQYPSGIWKIGVL